MDQRRELLHNILKEITENVYFNPPRGVTMAYPCIVYHRQDTDTKFADNVPYRTQKRYEVKVIDEDPDSPIPGMVGKLPTALHNRWYVAKNLNHDVFTLYF
jgi:hypothetical protein